MSFYIEQTEGLYFLLSKLFFFIYIAFVYLGNVLKILLEMYVAFIHSS